MLEEIFKQENLKKVADEIKNLSGYRPDLFKTIYKENMLSYMQACETEKKTVDEYKNREINPEFQK